MLMHNPPHPGEFIREVCLKGTGVTVTDAARRLGVSRQQFSALLNGRSGISPAMAVRLSKGFGGSPESWLKQQMRYDLWQVQQDADEIEAERVVPA